MHTHVYIFKGSHTRCTHLLQVQGIQHVHHVLCACVIISLVVLVGDVPTQRAKLASLLHCGMQEGYAVEQWLPLGQVGVVQLLLRGIGVGPLQTSFHALGRLKGVLDGGLEQVDGVFGVDLCSQPEAKGWVHIWRLQHRLKHLIKEVQAQVCVL